MGQLIVFAFPTKDGAYAMREALDELRGQQLLVLDDAAVVARTDDGKVRIKQATDLVGMGALGGAVWGALVGMVFLSPWLGMAVGTVAGALDDFIHQVGETVGPDQSALFLLIDHWDEPAVLERATAFGATVLRTALPTDDEATPPASDAGDGRAAE